MLRNLLPSAVVIVATAVVLIGLGVWANLPAGPVTVLTPDGEGGFIVEKRDARRVNFEQAVRDAREFREAIGRFKHASR